MNLLDAYVFTYLHSVVQVFPFFKKDGKTGELLKRLIVARGNRRPGETNYGQRTITILSSQEVW